ncbi:hypothetical protein ILYODFUR_010101 [Ilyodon furcidens]|uniref:Uncharacterized protein n=1 Tax=Ilyodon furcidens TaxID=33524 RepID=A0ABV0SJZ7_9TELE
MPTEHLRESVLNRKMGCLHFTDRQFVGALQCLTLSRSCKDVHSCKDWKLSSFLLVSRTISLQIPRKSSLYLLRRTCHPTGNM